MILELNITSLLIQQLTFPMELELIVFLHKVADVVSGLPLGPGNVKMSRN